MLKTEPSTCSVDAFFVDLDKTLLKVDLLEECIARLVCTRPWLIPQLALMMASSNRAKLKTWLSEKVELETSWLPFRQDLVRWLNEQRSAGSKIILATASHHSYAQRIAEFLGIFDGVIATTGINNKGAEKLRAIREYCDTHKFNSFGYVGDSHSDIPIWNAADQAIVVTSDGKIPRGLRNVSGLTLANTAASGTILQSLKLVRPAQWSKNVLLFVPLIVGHQLSNPSLMLNAIFGALAFSMAASAVYVLNDFVDVSRDRSHYRKRNRPFASGDIPLSHAPIYVAILLSVCAGLTILAGSALFAWILLFYLIANVAYSLALKLKPVIDVILLSLMYVVRVVAGGVVAGVTVSEWLLTFSMFFFLSLGCGKRYQELIKSTAGTEDGVRIRGYYRDDLPFIAMLGSASGLLSVLVLALYIQSPAARALYGSPAVLWFLCPVLIYWLGRFWIMTQRGVLKDDPLIYAFRDRVSLMLGVVLATILACSQWIRVVF